MSPDSDVARALFEHINKTFKHSGLTTFAKSSSGILCHSSSHDLELHKDLLAKLSTLPNGTTAIAIALCEYSEVMAQRRFMGDATPLPDLISNWRSFISDTVRASGVEVLGDTLWFYDENSPGSVLDELGVVRDQLRRLLEPKSEPFQASESAFADTLLRPGSYSSMVSPSLSPLLSLRELPPLSENNVARISDDIIADENDRIFSKAGRYAESLASNSPSVSGTPTTVSLEDILPPPLTPDRSPDSCDSDEETEVDSGYPNTPETEPVVASQSVYKSPLPYASPSCSRYPKRSRSAPSPLPSTSPQRRSPQETRKIKPLPRSTTSRAPPIPSTRTLRGGVVRNLSELYDSDEDDECGTDSGKDDADYVEPVDRPSKRQKPSPTKVISDQDSSEEPRPRNRGNCQYCDRFCGRDLGRHEEICEDAPAHAQKKCFRCSNCRRPFSRKDPTERHIKKKHKGDGGEPLPCGMSVQTFAIQRELWIEQNKRIVKKKK